MNDKIKSRIFNIIQKIFIKKEKEMIMILIGNSGETLKLNLRNSIEYQKEFEDNIILQRCLLNTNNDILNIIEMFYPIFYEIYGQKNKKEIIERLKRIESDSIIYYYSGHGNKKGMIFDEIFEYKELLKLIDKIKNKFIILETCFSGEYFQNKGYYYKDKYLLYITSSIQESGGWIMDGKDSNGIMTKCLIDPIGTYFKIKYKIFYESNNKLNEIYDKYSILILKELNISFLFEIDIRILKIYQNYLLLIKFEKDLFYPQFTYSYPDLSKSKDSKFWNLFEKEIEKYLIG